MKARLKRILSIALSLSLVWGLVGTITPVKSYAESYTIMIVWEDNNNQDGSRPDNLEVSIGGSSHILGSSNEWRASADIEATDAQWAIAIPSGYRSSSAVDNHVTTITLSHDPQCNHDKLAYQTNNPTCTENGNMAYWYCQTHNTYFSREDGLFSSELSEGDWIIPALGHAWGDWSIIGDGYHRRTCSTDGCDHEERHQAIYNNGVCTVCGLREPNYVAPVQPAPAPALDPEPDYGPIVSNGTPASTVSNDNDQNKDNDTPTPDDEAKKLLLQNFNMLYRADASKLASVRQKGITLNVGKWVSFNKTTYAYIDSFLAYGIPITVKYIYKGKEMSLTFPANLPIKLANLCDNNGYAGFEYLRGILLSGGYITAPSAVGNNTTGAIAASPSAANAAGSATAAASATTATAGQNTASIALSDKNTGYVTADDDIQYSSKVVSMLVATPFGGELIIDVTRGEPYIDDTIISTMIVRSDTSVTFNFFDGGKLKSIRIPSGSNLEALKERVAVKGKVSLISLVGQYNNS